MKSVIEGDSDRCCFLCGSWGKVDPHHIFGAACRKTSDKYGLIVHLCRGCHDFIHFNPNGHDQMEYLHKLGQTYYEENIGDRQKFIEEFIRSYL